MAKDNKAHFEVHPSVVYQLGESLISDAVQALIEMVKNSYDADAHWAKITIDTKCRTELPGTNYPDARGRILIKDDGKGMTDEELKAGWLLISNRQKLELKRAKKTTPGGRTPLGDKGLGRLGAQRLGDNLEIFTKAHGCEGQHMAFSWLDFATAPTLAHVDVSIETTAHPKGTTVVISDLRDIEIWRGEDAIGRLQRELSQMISPYKEIRQFMVVMEVDGKSLDLVDISESIRDLAPVRYKVDFDGETFSVSGRAKLDFFRPSKVEDADLFALIVESDDGKRFFDFMSQDKAAHGLGLKCSKSGQWFVEFGEVRKLGDLDKLAMELGETSVIACPGPFYGEIDSFDLGSQAFDVQQIGHVFDNLKDYRDKVKKLGGIRVYRDGFAVRVDQDWLKLGAQWTGARSYYGLKPENTHGFIALSAAGNMQLEETTDREGFKNTPYYRNFYALLTEFKRFTGVAHNFLGRSWSEFRKEYNEKIAHMDSRKTVEDMARTLKISVGDSVGVSDNLGRFKARLEGGIKESRATIAKMASATEITPTLRRQVKNTASSLGSLLNEGRETITRLSEYLNQLKQMREMSQVLEDRVEGLRRQMDDMYETVALGLTAEALSHEIFNIADQLAGRAKSALIHMRKKAIADRAILSFIEHVNTSVMALRKQISFLSPALRYIREKRENICMSDFLTELNEFYCERLAKNEINIRIKQDAESSLMIRMNRGKMLQVVDNLVLNSEYWLKEDIAKKRIPAGAITFEVDHAFMRIWDNGRGIDPVVEHALFEPFVSAKANGRGLGLFIIKQLLASEGCGIGVVPERNRHHRLYKFQIDFRGAINGRSQNG